MPFHPMHYTTERQSETMAMRARQEPAGGGLENNPFANKYYQQEISSRLQMETKWHATDRRVNFAHKPGTELMVKAGEERDSSSRHRGLLHLINTTYRWKPSAGR